ncbi:hypothetical protein DM860_014526 [Cuscuta australis]|uniref:DUF6598 domain-containing protein n=1 Tax=Cuscuta australis TaxID=267555 RepID=A0A328DXW6_9ASTE|nr:hypothetical protein DM860_014526 [Cuscuta australis]
MVALNIFGTVEVSINNNTHYLFKSNSNDGAEVEDSQKVLPLNVTCTSFDDYGVLELKVNLEDVCGKFQNRGFATYELGFRNHDLWYNTHICSVFPGRYGFCALHYSLFPRACLANIEIILKCKSFRSGLERIYGTAIAHYSNFDYSTKFKKDYFRSVLFKRAEKDPVPLKNDGKVPLSRSVVAVPMDSSLIIEVDFCGMSMKDFQSCTGTFEIGHRTFKTETNDYEVEMKLTWSEGLRYGLGGLDQDMGCRMDGVNQEKTGVKRKQPDQRNGGRDLDEAEGCRMGGANQTNTSVKRKQPDLRYGCNGSDEDEVIRSSNVIKIVILYTMCHHQFYCFINK